MKSVSLCARILFIFCILFNFAFADSTDVQPRLKSPGKALAWSLCGTILPNIIGISMDAASDDEDVEIAAAAVANTGTVLGPSVGYFYGGNPKRGWTGNAIRGALAGVFIVAVLESERSGDTGEWVAAVSSLVITIHAIVDIAQVDGAVRNQNERIQPTGWRITPKYFANHKAPGLELQLNW